VYANLYYRMGKHRR